MALAVRRGAGEDAGGAVRVNFNGGVLLRRAFVTPAGDLDVTGDADAELHCVTAVPPPGLLGTQAGVTGRAECRLERGGVIATVVERTECGLVGLSERRQQVPAADFGRIHADLGRE